MMLNNPIIQRELIATLRTRAVLWMQVGLVAALAALIIVRWPSDAIVTSAGADVGRQAMEVLRVFGYGLMVGVMLIAPAFPASSIVRERQSGTLDLLLNSPMGAGAILWGKVASAMGFVLLTLVITAPLAAACFTMGGVDVSDLLWLYVLLALLALEYVAMALWISTHAGTTDAALRMTYGGVLVLGVLTLGPHQFLQTLAGPTIAPLLDWLRAVSPIPAAAELLGQRDFGSRGGISDVSLTGRFVVTALILSAVFLLLTWRRLAGRLLDRPRSVSVVTDEMNISAQVLRRIMYLWFFDPRRRSGLIGPLTNPVMVKEFRTRRFGRSGWLMRLVAGCLIVSLLLMLLAARGASLFVSTESQGVEKLASIIVLMQVALIVLLTPSLASGLISSERESGGWALLQMTPLAASAIVIGKLLSVALVLVLVLIATLPGYVVLLVADLSKALRIVDVVATLALTALFSLMVSGMASSLFKRTATATAAAYAALVLLCAGTMLVWLAENAPFSAQFVGDVLRFNPLAAALQVIGAPGFSPEKYSLVPFNWYFQIAAMVVCLLVLIFQTWRLNRPS